jgi:hypothetical protein
MRFKNERSYRWTHVVPAQLRRGFIRLRHKFNGECLADNLGVSGLELGRVEGETLQETTVGVL